MEWNSENQSGFATFFVEKNLDIGVPHFFFFVYFERDVRNVRNRQKKRNTTDSQSESVGNASCLAKRGKRSRAKPPRSWWLCLK